jgi:NhaA family Na+:H+ antiporter
VARRLTFDFLKSEAASGAALALAAVAALVIANSPWSADYFAWLKSEHVLALGSLRLQETVAEWIKEGLMSVFFLVVGLEIKHEILRGELSDPRKLATPVLAALGGMVGPALVYLSLSGLIGAPHQGWPIPLATDIAFALAVFGLVGRGLPSSLRVFLLTLAIVDDLGAIVLIAALFSQGAHWQPLLLALGALTGIGLLAWRVRLPTPVWALSFALVWYLTLEAGLSTSLMGVAFAAVVPIRPRSFSHQSPLSEAVHDLHPWNAYLILPLFAFAKAGVSFAGVSLEQALAPLVIALALGLFFGKQLGVFGAVWLADKLKLGLRPTDATWRQVYGVSLLCGVGFTMSLFLGALAFPGAADSPLQTEVKLGVICGSLLSAMAGGLVLTFSRARSRAAQNGRSRPREGGF